MIYPRFVIDDVSAVADPLALYKRIWDAGVTAIFDAGGVINDHHGVGSTLSPYLERQWGPAFRRSAADQSGARSRWDHEPGQPRALSGSACSA